MSEVVPRRRRRSKSTYVFRRHLCGVRYPESARAMVRPAAIRAGAVGKDGRILDSELTRLLMVIAVMPGSTATERAFRAARINIGMALAGLGPALATQWEMGRGDADEDRGDDQDESEELPVGVGQEADRKFNCRVGAWIADRLRPVYDKYRLEDGTLMDSQIVLDCLTIAFRDPHLGLVLDTYRELTSGIKTDMRRFEAAIGGSLELMRSRWVKMARGRAA